MQLLWGTESVPANGAEITNNTRVVSFSIRGEPLEYETEYHVRAYLEDLTEQSQQGVSDRERKFRKALQQPMQDLVLKQDDGRDSSAALKSKDTLTGVRITNIEAPEATNGEWVVRRTIAFTAVARYAVGNPLNSILSYTETVEVTGTGGPDRRWRFPVNAPGIRQELTPFSLVTCVQSGEAVGFARRPNKPPALFPAYAVHPRAAYRISTPRNWGWNNQADTGHAISWLYVMERGDGPIVAFPVLPAWVR
jgi:hypothetical protein